MRIDNFPEILVSDVLNGIDELQGKVFPVIVTGLDKNDDGEYELPEGLHALYESVGITDLAAFQKVLTSQFIRITLFSEDYIEVIQTMRKVYTQVKSAVNIISVSGWDDAYDEVNERYVRSMLIEIPL